MITRNNRGWVFWTGMALLFIPGLIHAYLLMPFPGSQDLNAITICYYLEKIVAPLRVIGVIFLVWYLILYYFKKNTKYKIAKAGLLGICLISLYYTDFAYSAQKMFKEPGTVKFANGMHNKVPGSFVVLGVVNNGVAKAYPLIYLGYHHKVQDEVGGEQVLVTYCTMCRTGMVYSPVVNGKKQLFRLVGARHYNAIIEDQSTKTWWYQATGTAAVGPMKGARLAELPYEQSTLDSWLSKHPSSLILQPDGNFTSDYNDLKNYDRLQAVDKDSTNKTKDKLVRKSWVLGIVTSNKEKAYDWRQLTKIKVLNDSVGNMPVLMTIEKDSVTCHALNRLVDGKSLHFQLNADDQLTDLETASSWNWDGLCIAGADKGKQLAKLQAYQEYWHSWKHFHPATLFWKNDLPDNQTSSL